MPNPLIKKYAERAKTSEAHVEQLWDRAKQIAAQRFKGDRSPRYWAYVNGIVQRDLKLKEDLTLKNFLELTETLDAPEGASFDEYAKL